MCLCWPARDISRRNFLLPVQGAGGIPANNFIRSRLAAQTRVSPYCWANVTASLEGEALLAKIGIPERIALTAMSVGMRPLE